MAQEQESTKDITQSNSDNRLPPMFIFQDKHWSYIQRRYLMSPRELEIAELVCRGLTNDQIATSLAISCGTVKVHLRNIYRKIRVKSKLAMFLKFISATTHLKPQSHGQTLAFETETYGTTQQGSIDTGEIFD